jgi:hypothetical protein
VADAIDGLGSRSEKPKLNPSADLAAARLTPTEAFVLSRVDGKTSYEEICSMTGLGSESTIRILQKLRRNKLLLHAGEKPEPRPDTTKSATRSALNERGKSHARENVAPTMPSLLEVLDDGSPVDPAELAPGPELDRATKTRILRLHRRLKSLKPHELLAVPPSADLAKVKRAYFAASKEIHPDRFYGKDIGPYRGLLSDIFAQLTQAFEQLKK